MKAAEALSEPADRMSKVESKLDRLEWMVGVGIALNVGILVKLLLA